MKYTDKAQLDVPQLKIQWDRRERRRDKRRCSKCGKTASGRRQHLFVGRTGRALLCGSCVK